MNDGVKCLKDPIYGYIYILSDYMANIVDTSPFQRLRRIIQTSYSPLFASAAHNRFVHSLGVFHLGEIAFGVVEKEIVAILKANEKNNSILSQLKINTRTKDVFLLACLLHDIGHAPFSHTGEQFYFEEGDHGHLSLRKDLIDAVKSKHFENDVPQSKSDSAAPHEIMSVILALKEYSSFIEDIEDKEFFARCITGYKYSKVENGELNCIYSLKNCLITLLNSKIIDIDKLDYLIRDAYITGYDTVKIDYNRLLSSLRIVENTEGFEIVYHKSAISVIESVIFAHDSERKWIQNHPIILYENYLLGTLIKRMTNNLDDKENMRRLFSINSLSKEGQALNNNIFIRLLCDDDIIYIMKNIYYDEICAEYFERKDRMHPIWKSEAEYSTYIDKAVEIQGDKVFKELQNKMGKLLSYMEGQKLWKINDELIEKIKNEIETSNLGNLDEKSKKTQIKEKNSFLNIIEVFKKFAIKYKLDFDFVVIKNTQFSSGFAKPDYNKIKILFSKHSNETDCFSRTVSSFTAKENKKEDFYYVYYKRGDEYKENQTNIDGGFIINNILETLHTELIQSNSN